MIRFLAAVVVIAGFSAFGYGLWMIWEPLAWIFVGALSAFIGLAELVRR